MSKVVRLNDRVLDLLSECKVFWQQTCDDFSSESESYEFSLLVDLLNDDSLFLEIVLRDYLQYKREN